jgi:hypothetical protein
LIATRYGMLGRVAMFGSRLRRGPSGTIGIRLTVPAGSATGTATDTAMGTPTDTVTDTPEAEVGEAGDPRD